MGSHRRLSTCSKSTKPDAGLWSVARGNLSHSDSMLDFKGLTWCLWGTCYLESCFRWSFGYSTSPYYPPWHPSPVCQATEAEGTSRCAYGCSFEAGNAQPSDNSGCGSPGYGESCGSSTRQLGHITPRRRFDSRLRIAPNLWCSFIDSGPSRYPSWVDLVRREPQYRHIVDGRQIYRVCVGVFFRWLVSTHPLGHELGASHRTSGLKFVHYRVYHFDPSYEHPSLRLLKTIIRPDSDCDSGFRSGLLGTGWHDNGQYLLSIIKIPISEDDVEEEVIMEICAQLVRLFSICLYNHTRVEWHFSQEWWIPDIEISLHSSCRPLY